MSMLFLDEVFLTGSCFKWLIAKVVQGSAHLDIDIFRTMEVRERAIQDVYNLIDALQHSLVVAVSRAKFQGDHLLQVADPLEMTVLIDDTLILSLLKPVAVATGYLCQKLGIELRIVDGCQIVYLFFDHDTDEPS